MTRDLLHWFEIPVTDLQRAAAFYATVLGLEMKHVEAPPNVVMEWFESENPHGGGCLIRMEGREAE
jgi:uncharacterized protein